MSTVTLPFPRDGLARMAELTTSRGVEEVMALKRAATPLDRWSLPTTRNPMAAIDWTAEFVARATTPLGSAALAALGVSMKLDNQPERVTRDLATSGLELIEQRLQPMVRAPYFWSPDLCDLVYGAAPSLSDFVLTRETPPTPWGIFWYGKPLAHSHGGVPCWLRGFGWAMAQGLGEHPQGGFIITDSLQPHPRSSGFFIDVFEFLATRFDAVSPTGQAFGAELLRNGTFPSSEGAWACDQSYEESGWVVKYEPDKWMATPAEARLRAQILATSFLLLKQRVVVPERVGADRATSRRWAGKSYPAGLAQVTLRKAAPRPQKGEHPVEWSCRWVVSPHWRNYAVGPGRTRREPRFVSAFVKGPEGKPLRTIADRLFKVIR